MKIWKGIPVLTAEDMAHLDDLAMNEYQLSLYSMMENAGRMLARVAKQLLSGLKDRTVVCLVGSGHNGGGGLNAIRHLTNWGAKVEVVLGTEPAHFREVTAHQFRILNRMKVLVSKEEWKKDPDLFIDALLGYRGKGNPREPLASIISQVNASAVPILALDVPSGLDATSGMPNTPCIKATATLTLALLKTGLIARQAKPYVGDLYLADIGIPTAVYRKITTQDVTIFHEGPLINLSAK